jgi:hypothetical protein
MPIRELPEIARPTREEYITLLQDIALSAGVSSESIAELLKARRWTVGSTLTQGKTTQIRLAVEHEFPITLESRDPGRVFELAGQSDRNKTTTLIYLATLLGIRWEETRPFLDRDDKVYNVATRIVRRALSHGQRAELHLTSEGYDLAIAIADGRAILSLLDEQRSPIPDFNNQVIPLSSLEDWLRYCAVIEPLCDVQFVGKSRDFIGQVTVEESKDLILLCREVSDRTGRLHRELQDLPKEQIYGRTEQEVAEETARIKARLGEVKREIGELQQKIDHFHQFAQDGRELMSVWQVLEDDREGGVQELLRGLKLEEMVRDYDRRKGDLERMIDNLEQEVRQANEQLQQQEPPLTQIHQSLEALKGRIATELKELTTLAGRASQMLRCITQKDYDPVLTFCHYAQVSPETIRLLEMLLAASQAFSKGLLVPQDPSDGLGFKLSDLEKSWMTARAIAIDIQRLNPELTQAYQAFQAVNHSSAQDLRRLESAVATTQALLKDKHRRLRESRSELETTKETLRALLGGKEAQELRTHCHALRQALSEAHHTQFDRVEQLSHAIGYSRPWQLNLADLQVVIRDSEAKAGSCEEEKTLKEQLELQLGEMLQDIQRSERRTSVGRPQLDALREFQDTLRLIISYLDQFRLQREKSATYEPHQLEQLQMRLGKQVERVRETLNLVLRRRCPHMYKNRATGLEKLEVQHYDFLTGQQVVPDLQKGEWAGGGGDSAMTVLGLASRSTGSLLGTVLLVDEFNDAETFKTMVCADIAALDQVAFAIFVKQDPGLAVPAFEVPKYVSA